MFQLYACQTFEMLIFFVFNENTHHFFMMPTLLLLRLLLNVDAVANFYFSAFFSFKKIIINIRASACAHHQSTFNLIEFSALHLRLYSKP